MFKRIKNIDINYIQYGSGFDVVLLHGWGQNIQMMDPVGKNIKNAKITIIDLPGFGSSKEPEFAYTIDDYTELVHELLMELKIKNPVLIGHSFGGRISINYASKYEVSKVVLFGAPFKVQKTNGLKTKVLKTLKKIKFLEDFGEYMKKYIGSRDYKAASPIMRQILVNTVTCDLTNSAKKIKCPTLLIWGENDTEVSVDDARELEEIIEDAGLIVLPGSHYAYLENLNHVSKILNEFL